MRPGSTPQAHRYRARYREMQRPTIHGRRSDAGAAQGRRPSGPRRAASHGSGSPTKAVPRRETAGRQTLSDKSPNGSRSTVMMLERRQSGGMSSVGFLSGAPNSE